MSAACDRLERLLLHGLGLGFLALIAVVFLQVFARNLLAMPVLWTIDAAQLLFSWLIFIGSAVAVRRGAHYRVELFPPSFARTSAVLKLVSDIGIAALAAVLLVYGTQFVQLGLARFSEALAITEAWFFVPIPIAGALMLLFVAEACATDLRALAAAVRRA